MKRTIILNVIILLLTCIVFSCKKDYPDDIPKWLKEKIQNSKRNNDFCFSGYGCLEIDEWEFNNQKVYDFHMNGHDFYDISGNKICTIQLGDYPYCKCADTIYEVNPPAWKIVRAIWHPQSMD